MAIDPRVLIVIVNYRTGGLVVESLRSLAPEVRACPGARVLVVDNCSGDGSADVIAGAIAAEGWSDWANLDCSSVNGGFSYGNNRAIRPALASADPPDFFWLLNSDAQAQPGALRALVDFMQSNSKVGIVGSSLYFPDGEAWPYAFRFPSIWSELASGLRLAFVAVLLKRHTVMLKMGGEPTKVHWLPGASMMVRRQVFEQVGLMDEGYFLYYEETDFCLAVHRAGWECWYVPQSRVTHITGQSTGVTGEQGLLNRRPKYWFESRRRYFVKNHGWLYTAMTDLVWTMSFATLLLRSAIQRKPVGQPPFYFRDFLRNSAMFHRGIPINPALSRHGHDGARVER